jgi:hypothetical protein
MKLAALAVLVALSSVGCRTAMAPDGRRFTCVEDQRTEYPPFRGPQLTITDLGEKKADDKAVATK